MVLDDLALGAIAVFLPPLAVVVRTGCGANFLLSIFLCFLGWVPAVLHAWYVILEYPGLRQRRTGRRVSREYVVHDRSHRRSRSLSSESRQSYNRRYVREAHATAKDDVEHLGRGRPAYIQ